MNFMSLLGGGGGGGMSAADVNPYSKAIKAAGVQLETTGRGMATANPRISAALSGAAAGEHSAYARMAQNQKRVQGGQTFHADAGTIDATDELFRKSGNIMPTNVPHGGF